jgi:hypothetical protein
VSDGLFGISHIATAPYLLKRSLFGNSITVQAFDNAGNSQKITLPFKGYISEWWQLLVIILILGFVVVIATRRRKR